MHGRIICLTKDKKEPLTEYDVNSDALNFLGIDYVSDLSHTGIYYNYDEEKMYLYNNLKMLLGSTITINKDKDIIDFGMIKDYNIDTYTYPILIENEYGTDIIPLCEFLQNIAAQDPNDNEQHYFYLNNILDFHF